MVRANDLLNIPYDDYVYSVLVLNGDGYQDGNAGTSCSSAWTLFLSYSYVGQHGQSNSIVAVPVSETIQAQALSNHGPVDFVHRSKNRFLGEYNHLKFCIGSQKTNMYEDFIACMLVPQTERQCAEKLSGGGQLERVCYLRVQRKRLLAAIASYGGRLFVRNLPPGPSNLSHQLFVMDAVTYSCKIFQGDAIITKRCECSNFRFSFRKMAESISNYVLFVEGCF